MIAVRIDRKLLLTGQVPTGLAWRSETRAARGQATDQTARPAITGPAGT